MDKKDFEDLEHEIHKREWEAMPYREKLVSLCAAFALDAVEIGKGLINLAVYTVRLALLLWPAVALAVALIWIY
tara:strand:- start:1048 stop:1269 length:222 start_codon:yes stop_codon:yes gene_type:complete